VWGNPLPDDENLYRRQDLHRRRESCQMTRKFLRGEKNRGRMHEDRLCGSFHGFGTLLLMWPRSMPWVHWISFSFVVQEWACRKISLLIRNGFR
jgi:hypothetical protein